MRRIVCLVMLLAVPFAAGMSHAPAQTRIAEAGSAEITFWESVRDSKDPAEIEAYLKAYPDGRFAPLARIRLNNLKKASPQTETAAPPAAVAPSATPVVDAAVPPPPPTKQRGWIGTRLRSLTEQRARELGLAESGGAVVESVVAFGPSARSGLQTGDVMLSLDGMALTDMSHVIRLVSARRPGESLKLEILRSGSRQTLQLSVGNYFDDHWSSAHRGVADAATELGNIYLQGHLVGKDDAEASKWFRRAADMGHLGAMYFLGQSYQFGRGVNQDLQEAARWYTLAARYGGGEARAMLALGLLYHRGQGVERDLKSAFFWYMVGAKKGLPAAIHNYGELLNNGEGVAQDQAAAVAEFRRAAELGLPESFTALGRAYYNGTGVAKDLRMAAYWYREATERGQINGIGALAGMYERGEGGLNRNREEAIKLYRKAAEGDHAPSRERLKALKVTAHDPEEMRRLLAELGFDPGAGGGKSARRTRDAIRAFQKSLGIAADGNESVQLVVRLRQEKQRRAAAAAVPQLPASGGASGGGAAKPDAAQAPPVARPDFDKLKQLDAVK